ncbi:uncharacterized protein LOC128553833 [Mercenaria mercenaria]|uniref:uncharacterized protein LOC128553833 n=1 Tax=Mercenaria mercenaria TaxID=6596 RepID=UPI001E1D8CE8|nr:uncharacterized protein LOC128553833 [Mercenaria mercenaria]
MAEMTVSTEDKTELDYQLDFLNDDYFYKNFFFEEIPFGQNDVTVSQLLTVDTQQLYDAKNDTTNQAENKENTPAEVSNSRFQKPLSTVDIKNKQRNAVPANTTRSNIWAINVWKEWAENRNLQPETASEPGFPIPLDIGNFQSYKEMDFWLQRFICEIKRKNGEPYPPATLQNIAAGIQRYLRTEKSMHVNLFKTDDPTFAEFRKTLDSHMRELTNQGIGLEIKSADAVTADDEKKFWETGVFSMSSAKGLSNAVFFYNGKVFGLRGGEEQTGLLAEQFLLGYDSVNNRRYVKFLPRIRKNAQGGLKQSKKARGLLEPIVHYDQENSVDYSIYRLYETYLNLIPRTGLFYRKPLNDLKFSAGHIAQKDMKMMMKSFFSEAGIAIGNRNISNHSGRVTLCTTLYNQRYAEKTVMSRSKHVSSAVQRYQREQFPLNSDVSRDLEPILPPDLQRSESKPDLKNLQSKEIKHDLQKPVTSSVLKPDSTKTELPNESESVLTVNVPAGVQKVMIVTHTGKKFVMEI